MQDQATAQVDASSGAAEQGKPYKVALVAELLDIDESTVYREIKAGRLRALRIGAGRGTYRIPRDAFDAYVKELAAAAATSEGVSS
jgi:excisionase family DNA binding protein